MLIPNYDHDIPEMTVEVAKAAFPKGNAVMKIRDELGPLLSDDEFAMLDQRGRTCRKLWFRALHKASA